MADSYQYDFFLSYCRRPPVGQWVENHFLPVLTECLSSCMPREPRIFCDWQQDSGVDWPNNLSWALLRSRYLLAVWSPQYFRSRWCMAEWRSMRERELKLSMGTPENPSGLVMPVKYSDGDHFHDEAKRTQLLSDLSRWNFRYAVFEQSPEYLEFHREVDRIAGELAVKIDRAPTWKPDWPVVEPPPLEPPRARLPRLE